MHAVNPAASTPSPLITTLSLPPLSKLTEQTPTKHYSNLVKKKLIKMENFTAIKQILCYTLV